MFSSVDWKWLIIGLLLGWWVIPRIQGGFIAHAGASAKAQ